MSVARLFEYVQFPFTEQVLYAWHHARKTCPPGLTIHSKSPFILTNDILSHALFSTCLHLLIYSKDF